MEPQVAAPTAKISRSPKVVSRNLNEGEGGVLLHLESGNYHRLNATGWVIWSLIDGTRTFADLLVELRAQAEDFPPTIAEELAAFLLGLRARKLIDIALP